MPRDSNASNRSCTALDGWARRLIGTLPEGVPRALLAAVADASTPVMLVDRASTGLIYANRAAHRLLGYADEGLAGVRLDDLLAAVRPGAFDALLDFADQPEEPGDWARRVRLPLRRGDGQELTCPWLATLLAEEGLVVLTGAAAEARPPAIALSRDPLTGLPDRRAFESRLKQLLQPRSDWPGQPFALLFVDLDDFKRVNDQFGHLLGDALLAALARRLEAAIRPGDLAARHGGDEFVVILDRVRDEKAASRIAARLGSELRRPIGLEGREFSVSASVGIVLGRAGEGDPAGLLRAADAAMYQAKSLGGGRHVVFDKRTCPLARPANGPQ